MKDKYACRKYCKFLRKGGSINRKMHVANYDKQGRVVAYDMHQRLCVIDPKTGRYFLADQEWLEEQS